MKKFKNYTGFTLLEILLVIALIGVLVSIVLVAINPNRQLGIAQDLQRQQDLSRLKQALERYAIKNNGQYPNGILVGTYKEICGGAVVTNCVDLSLLVPTYLASLPTDPTGANYKIGINPDNNELSLWSELSYSGEVGVNKFVPI